MIELLPIIVKAIIAIPMVTIFIVLVIKIRNLIKEDDN
jgi:hypothetical protein